MLMLFAPLTTVASLIAATPVAAAVCNNCAAGISGGINTASLAVQNLPAVVNESSFATVS